MKKTLLFATALLLCIFTASAQKAWNLGGDLTIGLTAPAFPLSAGIGNGDGTAGNPAFPVNINGLLITGISTNVNMGAVNASQKTFVSTTLGNLDFPNRFQFNGAGYAGAAATDAAPLVNMPTQRYLSFNVSGNSTIYIIGITGSSSSARKIFVTDGTNYVGGVSFPAATTLSDGTVTYTGPAATLYVFGNAACNLVYLSTSNYVSTQVNQVLSDKGIIYNGSVISNKNGLELEVYNVLGKKVVSAKTDISTTSLPKGIYVVRAKGINETLKISI